MPELMKNKYYNFDSLYKLALSMKSVYPSFQTDDFVGSIMDKTWDDLELKARMRQMVVWAKNDNEHIRRLASEGCHGGRHSTALRKTHLRFSLF